VRVDVSARHRGKVQATLTETRRSLTELVLEPLRAEQYYEVNTSYCIFFYFVCVSFSYMRLPPVFWSIMYYLQMREPFSVMSIVKSPMGLMVGFMVVVVFLMPKLMENIGTRL